MQKAMPKNTASPSWRSKGGHTVENILAIVAIVISVISGLFSAFTYIKTMERDRKQATLDA